MKCKCTEDILKCGSPHSSFLIGFICPQNSSESRRKLFFYDCSSLSVLLVLSILARATKKIPERTIRCPVALWTSPVLTWCSVGFSAAHSHWAFMIRHHNPGKSNTFSLCGVVRCGGSVGGAFTNTKKYFLFPWCQKHWPTSVLRAEDPL